MKKGTIILVALLITIVFAGSGFAKVMIAPAKLPNDKYARDVDWTPAQVEKFVKQPWSKEELALMGEGAYVLNKGLYNSKRHTGPNLTKKQLYENGRNVWLPIMWQYGIGINMKTFKKIWIDEGKWKDPNHIMLDLRMETEYNQGHVPGAIWVDTGLDYWLLPHVAPKGNATYYLQCKSGAPDNGGIRGALVKRHMIDMGYTGEIYNLTDGFRGWIELGYPIINRHGQFTLVPGTFQKPDPYKGVDKGSKIFPWTPR